MSEKAERAPEHVLQHGGGRIVTSSDICGGRPRIRGTRVTVADLLNALAAGDTVEGLAEDLPDLTREDILAALSFAAANVDHTVLVAA